MFVYNTTVIVVTSRRDILGNKGMAEIIAQFYAQLFLTNETIAISG